MHDVGLSRGFLGKPFGTLLKTGSPLMKNVLKTLAKSVLILLGLTAAASATDADIHKKMFGSCTAILIISIRAASKVAIRASEGTIRVDKDC